MKREGRQRGMVRTHPVLSPPWNPRPKPANLTELVSPPTAGEFAKVSTKPTNHSKFTGKCGRPMCRECHIAPAYKSKKKVKGAQKLRSSSDVVSDYILIAWRVVDAEPSLKFFAFSATRVLDYLGGYGDYLHEDDNDVDEFEESHDDFGVNGEGIISKEDELTFSVVWELEEGDDQEWCLV